MSKILTFFVVIAVVLATLATAGVAASSQKSQLRANNNTYRPVVLLHGLFATSEAMSHIQGWLEQDFPGIYVHNLQIGNGTNKWDSLFINMNKQMEIMNSKIQADPLLREGGFDLIGHSQGGLGTRSWIERYGHLYKNPVHNYISLAGVQDGTYGVPWVSDWCPDSVSICGDIVNMMSDFAYDPTSEALFQQDISFAQYWKSPLNQTAYLKYSGFLADVNNEREVKNATYRQNLISVNKAIFLHALEDHIVVPSTSEVWQFYNWGQDSVVAANITQTATYQGDWIGLKTLDQTGKLTLASVNCTHQHMPRIECKSQVYEAWIKPNVGSSP